MSSRKKPTLNFDVEVTQRDINEAVQRGLSGAQMLERCIERTLQKMGNAASRKLALRRRRRARP